ncbi:MAG: TIGR00725 family protein [bacterium]
MNKQNHQYSPIRSRKIISVCCGADPPEDELALAYETGREIAKHDAILACGGLGGSMEEACRGAKEEGGLTIGIIPFYEKDSANDFVDIVIPTGLGHARNNLVAAIGDGVIGVGGSWGTLSEISIAVKMKKPVAVLKGWEVGSEKIQDSSFRKAETPYEAVAIALGLI